MVGPFEAVIAVTAIALGLGFMALLTIKIFGTIRHWIDSRSGNKLPSDVTGKIKELERFRQRAEKRIQNLETIIVDNDMSLPEPESESYPEVSEENRTLQNKLRS
ncbi:MAG: hypothetical protein WD037_08875 [Balneolales bacterium]